MNILEFLQAEGITTRPKGRDEYSSPCPVCGGNDRFQSWPERSRWFCRGCNKSGDLIDLVRLCKGLSFSDACRFVGEDHRISTGESPSVWPKSQRRESRNPPTWQAKPAKGISSAWLEKAESFIQWSHEQLLKDPDRLEWLKNDRGINLETVKRFKLGWNPKDFFRDRQGWGLPEEISQKTGKPKKLFLPSGLVIPGRDFSGKIARVKIRVAKPKANQPKYYFLPGGSAALCFFGEAQKAFIVVESELDAVLLAQESENMLSAISTGSAATRPDSQSLKALVGADLVLISLDSDAAGAKAAVQFWQETLSLENLYRWPIPTKFGKDHTEAFRNGFPLNLWLNLGIERKDRQENTEEPQASGQGEAENMTDDFRPVEGEENATAGIYAQNSGSDIDDLLQTTVTLIEKLKAENNQAEANELTKAFNTFEHAEALQDQQSVTFALVCLESLVNEGAVA